MTTKQDDVVLLVTVFLFAHLQPPHCKCSIIQAGRVVPVQSQRAQADQKQLLLKIPLPFSF